MVSLRQRHRHRQETVETVERQLSEALIARLKPGVNESGNFNQSTVESISLIPRL
jgi:hypothetical protein